MLLSCLYEIHHVCSNFMRLIQKIVKMYVDSIGWRPPHPYPQTDWGGGGGFVGRCWMCPKLLGLNLWKPFDKSFDCLSLAAECPTVIYLEIL